MPQLPRDYTRITINMSRRLRQRLRKAAAERDQTMSAYVIALIEASLNFLPTQENNHVLLHDPLNQQTQ